MNTRNITTALAVALVIGTVLNAINNYEVITENKWNAKKIIKVILTYITPFCVSLYSSVKAQKRLAIKTK